MASDLPVPTSLPFEEKPKDAAINVVIKAGDTIEQNEKPMKTVETPQKPEPTFPTETPVTVTPKAATVLPDPARMRAFTEPPSPPKDQESGDAALDDSAMDIGSDGGVNGGGTNKTHKNK